MFLAIVMTSFENNTQYFDAVFELCDVNSQTFKHLTFEQCKFVKCDFSNSQLEKCRFVDCEFVSCNFSLVKVNDSSFTNVIFEKSKCVGLNWSYARWPQVKLLSPIHFHQCDISLSSFYSLSLKEITIEECKAHEVDFRECDLTCAIMAYSDFLGSQFVNTILDAADFTQAQNYNIDVNLNSITKAKFTFPEVVNLLKCLDIKILNLDEE